MKRRLTIFTTLLIAMLFTIPAPAQTISMGTSPIEFGNGCAFSFIKNPNFNKSKIEFGYSNFCFGIGVSGSTIFMDTEKGRLGIGVSNPSYRLQLNQNSAAKPGSSSWIVISDKRYKENVNAYNDGLEVLRKIRPVTYQYKEGMGIDTREEFVGVIAQELQTAAPYMVRTFADEKSGQEYLGVDLHAMDFILTNSVMELDSRSAQLEKENAELKNRLAALEALVLGSQGSVDAVNSVSSANNRITSLSPNPSSGTALVQYQIEDALQKAHFTLYNTEGKAVWEQGLSQTGSGQLKIDTESLPSGLYFLNLENDGKQLDTQRMLINH